MKEEKIQYKLLITPDEERVIQETMKNGLSSLAWTIIKKAEERGDFIKIK